MRIYLLLMMGGLLVILNSSAFAKNFNLDSPRNEGAFRFEIDNDTVWSEDSNFSNGWSLQYHTVRYDSWDESKAPGFMKWIGNHFPTLGDEDSIVRYGHGIGQNMITPGDLKNPNPPEGDLPYAGTLTYAMNWQAFNRNTARNFQINIGILGDDSAADSFQKEVHSRMGDTDYPEGWDTQRDSEPILNFGYQHLWNLADFGVYDNHWAGQLSLAPSVHLGNLITAVEVGLAFRFGWNIQEGFNTFPAPPGRGFYQGYHVPKPASASPHGVEVTMGIRATGLIYSVLYDGSIITDDDRDVEREYYVLAGGFGLNYHYYDFFSLRLSFLHTTDLLDEDELPPPQVGTDETSADTSYGTLIIDFYF